MKARIRLVLGEAATPLFRAWMRLSRPMTLGVRALVFDEAGRVGLVRHTYKRGWHLPGGGVERGETAALSIVRECREELGADPLQTALVGVFRNPTFAGDHIVLYQVSAWRACETDSEGEIAETGWFDPHDLPEAVTPATRRRLAEWREKRDPPEDW